MKDEPAEITGQRLMRTGTEDDASEGVTIREALVELDGLRMEQDAGFDMAAGLADVKARIDRQCTPAERGRSPETKAGQ